MVMVPLLEPSMVIVFGILVRCVSVSSERESEDFMFNSKRLVESSEVDSFS